MKVMLSCRFDQLSGYGMDGIGLARALVQDGHDVHLHPVSLRPPIPADIAFLLQKTPIGRMNLFLQHENPEGARLDYPEFADYNVMWTMWEFPWWWHDRQFERSQFNANRFDWVTGYDENTVEAMKILSVPTERLLKVQGGFDPTPWRLAEERDWTSSPLKCLMLGETNGRKNPMAAFEAVEQARAKGHNVTLTIKSSSPTAMKVLEPQHDWLTVDAMNRPQSEIAEIYASHHVLLAPSLGEGKNVPALEFAATGGVVIASECSGHKEWMSEDICYSVPLEIIKEHKILRVPVASIVDQIVSIDENRRTAMLKGVQAAKTIPAKCSWDAALGNLLRELRLRGVSL
jgi:glycosyltransferase involved in cell wall biosynthesis